MHGNNVFSTKRTCIYPIRDIVLEAKALEKQGVEMIYLNIGDPAPYGFRPPRHVLDAVQEALKENNSGYAPSQGDPVLVKEIARVENVNEEDVFVTTGLTEGIDFLFSALLDPGHNILLPSPTYPLYVTKEKIYDGVENYYAHDDEYQPDLDSVRKSINEKTKAIVIINPNNPTGAVYSEKNLKEMVDLAGEFNIPIIADHAYDLMVFDGEFSDIRKLHKDVPLIVGSSLSKNYLYPGARVGWVSFHGEGMENLKEAFMRYCNQRLSVNGEMQKGAIAALQGNHDHIDFFNKELRIRRDVAVKRLNEIETLSVSSPKGAFYAFPKIESNKWKDDWEFCRDLLKAGVVTVPGKGFSSTLDGLYFRITLLPPPEQLEVAFERTEKMMKEKQ
jgi:aspartate/methionine/tyrosine aminotransferase